MEDSEPQAGGSGKGRSRRGVGREVVEEKETQSERQRDRQRSRWPHEGAESRRGVDVASSTEPINSLSSSGASKQV